MTNTKTTKKKKESKHTVSIKDLCYVLTMLFCSLRACGVIGWKWYWVMSPILLCIAIDIILLVVAGCIALRHID